MFKTLADLAAAIRKGQYAPAALSAVTDGNELYVYDPSGTELFGDVVTPEEVAKMLGIQDVNDA